MTNLAEAVSASEINIDISTTPHGAAILALVAEVEPVSHTSRRFRFELRELEGLPASWDMAEEVESRLLNYIAAAEVVKQHTDGETLTTPEVMLGAAAEAVFIRS